MAETKTVNVETTNARASTTLTDTTPTVPLPDLPQGLMVVGPQVTLHFVEGEWNKGNSYDYYDVVQVDGTSYIAVQDVPANTEITNTEYWAKWNDPNAQLALLQQTVEQFDGRINELETADDNLNNLISPLHLKLYEPSNGYLGDSYPAGEGSIALSGGAVIHKRPYGSYSDAAGIFVNVGDNDIDAPIYGRTNMQTTATYPYVGDTAGLSIYGSNMPPVVTLSAATFSATGLTTSEVFDTSLVKVNMLVLAKSASSEYIGFVTSVDSNSISVGGWYKRSDGTKGTPDAGSVVYIGMSQRFYGIVVDAQIEDSDIFDGSVVGMEVGIRNNSTTAKDSTGIIITGRFGDVNTTAQLITSDTENKWTRALSIYKADNILCFENNIAGSVLSTHTQVISNPNNSFINTDFKDGRNLIRNQFSEENAWTLKNDGTMSTVRGQISYNSNTANNGFIHIVSDGNFKVSTITENQVIMIYATAGVTFDQSVNQITASGPSQINSVAAFTLGILFRTSPSNVYYVKIV